MIEYSPSSELARRDRMRSRQCRETRAADHEFATCGPGSRLRAGGFGNDPSAPFYLTRSQFANPDTSMRYEGGKFRTTTHHPSHIGWTHSRSAALVSAPYAPTAER